MDGYQQNNHGYYGYNPPPSNYSQHGQQHHHQQHHHSQPRHEDYHQQHHSHQQQHHHYPPPQHHVNPFDLHPYQGIQPMPMSYHAQPPHTFMNHHHMSSGSHHSTPPAELDRQSPIGSEKQQHQGHVGKWKGEKEGKEGKEGPVKNACLSCRSKKAKCDGVQPICGQCDKKALECVYVKSRRGGARKKKDGEVKDPALPPSALQEFLKKLDGLLGLQQPLPEVEPYEPNEDMTDIVRQFSSRDEILACYYNEVHPFLPVMPQRHHSKDILPSLLAESPFILAVQTILVLVPHPMDQNPNSVNSKRLRTAMSNYLGSQTIQLVDRLIQSSERTSIECVQALTILSLWEWGNAGNLTKNRARAGQAIQVAMEIGLHEMDKFPDGRSVEGEWRADMARRTWWVTFVAQLTAAIISGNEPVLGPDDPRVRVDYPVCSLADNAWPNWVEANKQCLRVFSLVNSVYYGQAAGETWGASKQAGSPEEHMSMASRMLQVDREVLDMMKQAEEMAVIDLVPGGEEEVVRNQQLSARLGLAVVHIHIHRQQAFPEVSLFSKRICGLPQAPDYSKQIPLLDSVAVPQALTNGEAYSESPQYKAMNRGMRTPSSSESAIKRVNRNEVVGEMWQPDTFPEDLPAPWFAHSGGAARLYSPTEAQPRHVEATIVPITSPRDRRFSTPSINGQKQHKAWGVDEHDRAVQPEPPVAGAMQIFPPGISLARCATAAHTIVRLEVLHRSATIAMWKGPPKWLPFCACGLVTGAYAFLLLALAVQAENTFGQGSESKAEEVEALLTNVKVILAGLEAYGQMWGGIEVMAGEVRAALEAAARLPNEVRAHVEIASTGSPGDLGTVQQHSSSESFEQQRR